MQARNRFIWLILWLSIALLSLNTSAQTVFDEYRWQAGDITLRVPASWQTIETERDDRFLLTLADRPIESVTRPSQTATLLQFAYLPDPNPNIDVYTQMANALREWSLVPVGLLPGRLLERDATAANATSFDGRLVGYGRAIEYDDGAILWVLGRSPVANADDFLTTFNIIVDSMVPDADAFTAAPDYGVLWRTTHDRSLGQNALLDIRDLVRLDDVLYVLDEIAGVARINARTGAILSYIPLPDEAVRPLSLAVADDGTLYIGDEGCGCIYQWQPAADVDNQWQMLVAPGTFGDFAPQHMALSPDGTLYATDINDDGLVSVLALRDGDQQRYFFEDPLLEQPPILIGQDGALLALTQQATYQLQGVGFSPVLTFETPLVAISAVEREGDLFVIATQTDGILIVDAAGIVQNEIVGLVQQTPTTRAIVRPVGVAATDGLRTIFWADSDGTYGNITAASLAVVPGRIGTTNVTAGTTVQGELNADTTRQLWTYEGQRGETIALTATSNPDSGSLDVALDLLAPDGSPLASNDTADNPAITNLSTARIEPLALPRNGLYTIVVQRQTGSGAYTLGIERDETVTLTNGQAEIRGRISDAVPVQRWLVPVQAGQRISVTMQTSAFNPLDPFVRLYNSRGDLVIENDDAADTALGRNAQLVDVQASFNGLYVVEATRFTGSGDYTLTISVQ